MNFDDYRLGDRAKYVAFVDAIRQIITAAVKVAEMNPHAITGRAKDVKSLEKKLADRGIDPASAIDEQIKDLAGTRVVFLTNAQVQRFLGSRIIHDNFDVISVNVHHAVPNTENETQLFSSTNYFVQLNEQRLALPEYAPHAGLRAEIQVQTLLNHAWAEMDHDTFYKEPAFRHIDRSQFERIKQRMDSVMREHLLPAGHDFDKISRDMTLLMKAEAQFEPAVETIRTSTSNDELSSAIGTLDEIVMPRLSQRSEKFLELLPDLVSAVARARTQPPSEPETTSRPVESETGSDIARKFAVLLQHHRYADPAQTLSVLLGMYRSATSDDERSFWVEQGKEFARHDVSVWRTHGPANQRVVVDGIGALTSEEIESARGVITGMLEKVLSLEIGGTSLGDDVNTVIFHQGTVAPSEALNEIRQDAISILERILQVASNGNDHRTTLHALREATRPPYHGGSAALRTMVMTDAKRVIGIERAFAPRGDLELRRQMEVAALHVHSWYNAVPPKMADNPELIAAQAGVVAEVLELRDELNRDGDFALYKTLIGHDSVRPQAWVTDPFDYRATDAWRLAEDVKIIAVIDAEGADAWCDRVRRYLAQSFGSGDSAPLAGFCTRLAAARPDVIIHFLDQMDETLSAILVASATGLDQAGLAEAARAAASRWIGEGRFLTQLADWLGSRRTPDPAMLADLAARAHDDDDHAAMLLVANSAARLWGIRADQRLIDNAFMPAVAHFLSAAQPGWIRHAWQLRQGALVGALNEDQVQLLLDSFVAAPEIDYDGNHILSLIASRRPKLVLNFFEARIKRGRDKSGWRFDPVPFRIHDLQQPLALQPQLLLDTVRRWYDLAPNLHQFRGGRLIHNVFPTLPDAISDPLRALVRSGRRDDLAFVLATLQTYDGSEEIYPLCMDVVDRLEPGDEMLRQVSAVLGETGVVTGEFGHVEAEGEQRSRLAGYLEDPRPNVRAFAEDARRHALQSMAWEQRQAEQYLEQMRRDWN